MPEVGRGWSQTAGAGPEAGPSPRRFAHAHGGTEGAGLRARGARAPEGGVQASAGRGRGRGGFGVLRSLRPWTRWWLLRGRRRDRRGCDGWPLASPAVLGPVGRWATHSRAAAEEAARPPHGESQGRGESPGAKSGAGDEGRRAPTATLSRGRGPGPRRGLLG